SRSRLRAAFFGQVAAAAITCNEFAFATSDRMKPPGFQPAPASQPFRVVPLSAHKGRTFPNGTPDTRLADVWLSAALRVGSGGAVRYPSSSHAGAASRRGPLRGAPDQLSLGSDG